MPRPIWKGNISFGLVYIPVTLYPAIEAKSEIHFHLMDNRNHARVRYQRVNEETGKEVPWDEIVKAYEFDKGNYVTVDQKELEQVAAQQFQTVEIEGFIDKAVLASVYFDKPYYLIPDKHGEKGYLLLLETLLKTQKIGIARVVIKTRQHLACLVPYKNALVLNLLRFPDEIRDVTEFQFAKMDLKKQKVSTKEIDMAERLVRNMTLKWNPKKYHDESKKLLRDIIQKKIKKGKGIELEPAKEEVQEGQVGHKAKVVDFMDLLKRSVEAKGKTMNSSKKSAIKSPRRSTQLKSHSKSPTKSHLSHSIHHSRSTAKKHTDHKRKVRKTK